MTLYHARGVVPHPHLNTNVLLTNLHEALQIFV